MEDKQINIYTFLLQSTYLPLYFRVAIPSDTPVDLSS